MENFAKAMTALRHALLAVCAGIATVFVFLLFWRKTEETKVLTPDIKLTEITDTTPLDHADQSQTDADVASIQAKTKAYLEGNK